MRAGVQGLGWFVRRAAEAAVLGRFYHESLHLPILRQWDTPENSGTMFYAGGVASFEINRGGRAAVSDPALAECTPIFRARDLDAALKEAVSAGALIVGEESSRTVFLRDTLGHVFGLRAADGSTETALPGLPALPECLHDIGAVRLRVEDPQALAAFYAEMLGLDVLNASAEGAALHMGLEGVLELRPGGVRRSAPQDRVDVTDVWILRVYDYVALKAHLAVNRVHLVNAVELAGGWLDYYVDPEGHLFGFQERRAPDPAIPNSNLIEDKAARERWLAAS